MKRGRVATRLRTGGTDGAAVARLVGAALVAVCLMPSLALAQDVGAPTTVDVSGTVNVTSKGISNVPALTLGRPAMVFDLFVRKGSVGFEPQFRFDLHGKPWSFLLWGRYRAVQGDTFRLTLGAHPSFSFRSAKDLTDGVERDVIQARRYVAGDITPTWALTDRATVGGYYLYSKGLDFGAPPHTHLAAVRASVANIELTDRLVLQIGPQAYFLRTNGQNGTYANASASVGLRGSPISVNTMVNVPIDTAVAGGQDVLWNVSVTYAFR